MVSTKEIAAFVGGAVLGWAVAWRAKGRADGASNTTGTASPAASGGATTSPGNLLPTGGHPDARLPLADLPPLKNDLLLRAARGEAVERVPVWAMRQAGRYLPEFKEVRKAADFFTMCRTPELACKVTLQPLERFPTVLDAVIIFSDILIVPQAMGMEVNMVPGKGPVFPSPLGTGADVAKLDLKPDIEAALGYLFDAINLTRRRVEGKVPVIGFAGGPWTLMAYMVEGGGSKTFAKAKQWLFRFPREAHQLLTALSDIIIELLVGEYQAGAQYLQVFESWSGELSQADFTTFLLPQLHRIADGVKARVPSTAAGGPPLVVFPKGAHYSLEALATSKFDVIGFDWTLDPATARRRVGSKAVQGNLDPCVLYGGGDFIKQRVEDMLRGFGDTPLVANLGHGMHPTHKPEQLQAFFTAVTEVSTRLRAAAA